MQSLFSPPLPADTDFNTPSPAPGAARFPPSVAPPRGRNVAMQKDAAPQGPPDNPPRGPGGGGAAPGFSSTAQGAFGSAEANKWKFLDDGKLRNRRLFGGPESTGIR